MVHKQLSQLNRASTLQLINLPPTTVHPEGGQTADVLPCRKVLVPLATVKLGKLDFFEDACELVHLLVHQLARSAPLCVEINQDDLIVADRRQELLEGLW